METKIIAARYENFADQLLYQRPGAMEHGLVAGGLSVRVIENCLNGRRTVWDDRFKPGRNGLQGIE